MTLHEQTVPTFCRMLRSLSALLETARKHAEASGYDVSALLAARLFPDMFTLTRQVQLATDFAKGACARLAGEPVPRWEDTESSLDDVQARIGRALAYVEGFAPARFEGSDQRTIELKTPGGDFRFLGRDFVHEWALPNFYFHVTTAYNLLRHNGVPVGKLDFLGKGRV